MTHSDLLDQLDALGPLHCCTPFQAALRLRRLDHDEVLAWWDGRSSHFHDGDCDCDGEFILATEWTANTSAWVDTWHRDGGLGFLVVVAIATDDPEPWSHPPTHAWGYFEEEAEASEFARTLRAMLEDGAVP